MEKIKGNLRRYGDTNGRQRYYYRRLLPVVEDGKRKYRDIRRDLGRNLEVALTATKRLDEQVECSLCSERRPSISCLGEFHDWYVAYLRDGRKLLGWRTIIGHIRRFVEHTGPHVRLERITPLDVEYFLQVRRRCVGPWTVGGYLRSIRRMFNVAIRHGYLERNPTVGLRTEKPPIVEPRLPAMEDVRRLLEFLRARRPRIYSVVVALIHTGARLGEVLSLDWSRVDFSTGSLALVRRKVGDEHRLVMAKPLSEVLHALWIDAGMPKEGYVFLGKAGRVLNRHRAYLSFKGVVKTLGLPWLTLKTFRKLAATWVVQATHDVRAAQMLLGHSNLHTTEDYLGGKAESREIAVRAIEKRMME